MGMFNWEKAWIPLACLLSAMAGCGIQWGSGAAAVVAENREILSVRTVQRPFSRADWLKASVGSMSIVKRGEMVDSLMTTLKPGTKLDEVLSLLGSPDDIEALASSGVQSEDRDSFRAGEVFRVSYWAGYTDNSMGPLADAMASAIDLYFSKDSQLLRVGKYDGWTHY